MAISAKVQRDYYLTETSIDLSADVKDVHEVLRASKTSGKMVVLYNNGYVQGINVEQKTKISDAKAAQMRPILDIEDTPV